MWVSAEGEKGVEAGNCGCVGCARATHDDWKIVDFSTHPVLANGIGEGVYFSRFMCAVLERLWSVQYFHSPI
jgi:hypothetical protein